MTTDPTPPNQPTIPAAPKSSALYGYATQVVIALLVTSFALAIYHQKAAPTPSRFGVVDVASVYRDKEKQFTELVTKPGVADKEREAALAGASNFAKALPAALDALSRDCACTLLISTAVAGHGADVPNLTAELRKRLPA